MDSMENITESETPYDGDAIRMLSLDSFRTEILGGKGPRVVEFMSYSCSHCGVLEPVLQKVAKLLKARVKIFRVNTATEQELVSNYSIDSTPTLIMFLNGRNVGRIEGPGPTVASLLTAIAQPFRSTK